MTKTQYFTATSVDGYIADADNSLDWLFEVPRNGGSGAEGFGAFFAGVGAMAMGATTYEWVLGHEPEMLERPHMVAGAAVPALDLVRHAERDGSHVVGAPQLLHDAGEPVQHG